MDVKYLRFIFSQIKIHPAWNVENRASLAALFDLDNEHLDALHDFTQWVANHGLEQLELEKETNKTLIAINETLLERLKISDEQLRKEHKRLLESQKRSIDQRSPKV